MPRVKTEHVYVSKQPFSAADKFVINVSAAGIFYCDIRELYVDAAQGCFDTLMTSRKTKVLQAHSATLDKLVRGLNRMLLNTIEITRVEEHIIQYNIQSEVAFCLNDAGEVVPNGYWVENQKARWEDSPMYGKINASSSSAGGYKLIIGAQAMTKTTVTLGDSKSKKIAYSTYYKGKSHLGTENPAQKLNSWTSFRLDTKHCKEIPYTDEAALFFHNLLLGMAKLSRLIQESTFDQEQLMLTILNNPTPLLGRDK
jgi:hypothetical protein